MTAIISERSAVSNQRSAKDEKTWLVFWVLILLMIAAYIVPWVMSPGVSLSLAGYDLAEWTSLNPVVHAESPALFTTLLLRFPLVSLGLIVAFAARGRFKRAGWWFHALFTLGAAVALLPPLEYFKNAGGDVNYGQQFTLALAVLVVGLIGLSGLLAHWQRWIVAGIALLAGVSGVWGLLRGVALIQEFNVPVSIAAGGILLAVFCAAMIFLQVNKTR